MQKKKVLVFCGYYLPGYKAGGPIRTIANMIALLSDSFDFYIVTGDRDALDEKPYAHLVNTKGWLKVGKAEVLYLSPKERGYKNIREIIKSTPHDVLYLNSFFSYDFTIKPLLLRRLRLVSIKNTVLAPRGELSEGALSLKNHKKKAFSLLSSIFGLYRGVRWHASSVFEKEDVIRVVGGLAQQDVCVAKNLPDVSSLSKKLRFAPREKGGPLRVVFLSRISPMKNLEYAINVLSEVGVEVLFHIYGASNDVAYYEYCMRLLGETNGLLCYEYKGLIDHDKVVETLSSYDLFFLPTKGENYGHVILESLTAGTPVLISDRTPWKNLEDERSGWVLSLDEPKKFVEKIEDFAGLTVDQQLAMRDEVTVYAKSCLLNEEIILDNKRVFQS